MTTVILLTLVLGMAIIGGLVAYISYILNDE
jgi:hypothetical protein